MTLVLVALLALVALIGLLAVAFWWGQAMQRRYGSETDRLRSELNTQFRSALEQLSMANDSSLKLVEEKFDKHQRGAKEGIEGTIKPIKEDLARLQKLLNTVDSNLKSDSTLRSKEFEDFSKHSHELQQATSKLSQILHSPKTRGRWGEIQLRNLFEMAGMNKNFDFFEQPALSTDESTLRPDAIIRIPNGKAVIVDAKTPFDNYFRSLESGDEELSQTAMKRYAQDFQEHIKALGKKSYSSAVEDAFDFVVMFVPNDSFLAAATEQDSNMVEKAFKNKVLICTPVTMMALLKVVAYSWQQQRVFENASSILQVGAQLLERLETYQDHFGRVGSALENAAKHFHKATGSFERRVLPSAHRLKSLSEHDSTPEVYVERQQSLSVTPRTGSETE